MLIDEIIKVKVSKKNITHFKNLGINCNLKDIIDINPINLNGGSHILVNVKCDICGNEKQLMFQKYIKNIKNGGIYCCSSKCAQQKVKNTSMKKFGNEYYTQTDEYRERVKKTSLENYGVNHFTQNDKVKNKIKETNLSKYGVDNVFKSEIIKDKIKKSNISKYGVDNVFKSEIVKDKIKETNILIYNCEFPSQNEIIRNKIKETNILRYGVDNPTKSNIIINKLKLSLSKNLMVKYPNIINVDIDKNLLTMTCDNGKNHEFKIHPKTFQSRKSKNIMLCTICNNGVTSTEENIINKFIKESYSNKIIENDRKILEGKELDIYLPDLNLAFEFNGLYWHNEIYKNNNYHKIKTDLCLKKGIQLIHIYEDEWIYKQEIVKSMILNKLNKTPNKIFARKCQIKEINDNKLIRNFLNENHIQGFVGSKLKIGLFYNSELVSLMTFGKLRKPLNSKSKSNNEYEMLRFCNILNTNVVGGASKLFKYFINKYKPEQVISYASRSYSNGKLYEKIGFKLQHITKPNYYYIIDGIKNYRFNFRKDILVKQGFDSTKSEHEIMLERKIYRIYDSGSLKFKYNK